MCVEADNFIARTSGLDVTHQNAYQTLICGLVTDGVWAKLDALYTPATADETTARLNLVQNAFNLTPHGSPGFTPNGGYTGVNASTTVYLDTGFVALSAGGVFTQNSAHMSAWSATNSQSTASGGVVIGQFDTVNQTQLVPWYSDGTAIGAINCDSVTADQAIAAVTDSLGFYVASRTAAHLETLYKNGSSIGTTVTSSVSVPSLSLLLLARNGLSGASIGSGHLLSAASIGGGLSSSDVSNLYTRLTNYLAAIVDIVDTILPVWLLTA